MILTQLRRVSAPQSTCGAPLRRRSAPHPLRLCIWGAVIAPQNPPWRLSSFTAKAQAGPASAVRSPEATGDRSGPALAARGTGAHGGSPCSPAPASGLGFRACGMSSSAAGVSGGGVSFAWEVSCVCSVCFGGSRELPSWFGSFVGGVVGRVLAAAPRASFAVGCASGGDALALQSLALHGAAARVSVFCAGDASGAGFWRFSAFSVAQSVVAAGASPVWLAGGPSRPRCGSGWRLVRARRSSPVASRCRSRAGFCSRPCRVARWLRLGRRRRGHPGRRLLLRVGFFSARSVVRRRLVGAGARWPVRRRLRLVAGWRCAALVGLGRRCGARRAVAACRTRRCSVRPARLPAVFSCGALGRSASAGELLCGPRPAGRAGSVARPLFSP